MASSTNATDTTSWTPFPAGVFLFFSALNILLSITASVGNALILIALYKVSSIYPPTKWLFGSLAVTDLCVGLISQPLYAMNLLMLTDYIDIDDWFTYASHGVNIVCVIEFFFIVLFVVSVLTSTAISVDRLLALLLRLRYRHVVTLRRVRVVIGCFWSFAVLYGALFIASWIFFDPISYKYFISTFIGLIILSITIPTFCYIKIFLKLRHQQAHIQDHVQPGQLNGGGNPLNIARYKKTVWSIAWVQLALLTCFAPFAIICFLVWHGNIKFSTVISVTLTCSVCLLYLNSSLNPILYCWRIRDVRQEVKNILRKCAPC